jgi:hypothetical protein
VEKKRVAARKEEEAAMKAKTKAAKIKAAAARAKKNAVGSDDFSDDESPKHKASPKDKAPKACQCHTCSIPFHCLSYIFPRLACSFSTPILFMYLTSIPILCMY